MIAPVLRLYEKLQGGRDWLLGKIEYLQSESAKWRTLFNVLKSPYSLLRALGFSPQMAIAVLMAGSSVSTGVVVQKTLLSEPSFSKGDPGVYSAPDDVPVFYSTSDNTLRVDLGTTPVGEITIDSVTVGTAFASSTLPAGETSVVIVGGSLAAATYLEIGHLIVDRWRCTTFSVSDVEAHTLNIIGNASDGQSISPVAGTPRRRGIGGGNRAEAMTTESGTYDQIVISAPNAGVNGQVDVMTLSNIFTKGGLCELSRIRAGTVDILLMEVGLGNGFSTKEFVVASTTVYKIANITDNVEVSISPPP